MNKNIQEQLKFILSESEDNKKAEKHLVDYTDPSQDLISSNIHEFFSSNSAPKKDEVMEENKQMEEFRAKKSMKDKVMKDVNKFIASLPADKAALLVANKKPTSVVIPPPHEEEEEEVKVREITKPYLVKKLGTEDFSKVEELKLKGEKIARIELLDRFINLKVLILDDNNISKIECMKHLRQLEDLSIRANKLTNARGIDCLANLKYLDLSLNQIEAI